jgi:phosphate transport system substrate-binding protein
VRGAAKNVLVGVVLVLLVVAVGAWLLLGGLTPRESESRQATQATQTPPPSQVILLGSGATFIHPQLDNWAKQFNRKHPHVRIDYNPTGSGTGQTQFMQKVVDFAGSDPPLPTSRWQQAKADPRGVVQMPIIIGAVVMVYNIPGFEGRLKLDGETIALIYLGEIEYWNDPRIQRLNPDLKLPNQRIIAVHRSDSSGTTHVFTLFLYKASNGKWPKELVEKAIEWPVDKTGRGLGGKGNQGVADLVQRTPYSIGYVEYAYAYLTKMPYALVKNAAGKFVDATTETMMEAAKNAFPKLPPSLEDDFNEAWDAIVYAPGEKSYPITSFSFLIFYKVYSKEKVEAVKKFIEFTNTEGQKPELIVPGYIPIPEEVRRYNLRALELIREG